MKGAIAIRKPTQTTSLDMSGTNVTTSAWATLLAAASNLYAGSVAEFFNPSGSTLKIALGGAGSEVELPYLILPGGSAQIGIEIPRGARVSLKAVDTSVTTGLFVMNRFG